MSLYCDHCNAVMKWKCPNCGCQVYTPSVRGYELGFWGSFAVGFLGIQDWRTQILAAQGFDHANERAILCNCCGNLYKAIRGTTEEALRCRSCGKGHYVVVDSA